MRQIIILFTFCFLFTSTAYAQIDTTELGNSTSTTVQPSESDIFPFSGTLFWKSSCSINKYSNYKTCETIENSFFETNLFSFSTITSKDKITRISSNYAIVVFPLMFSALALGNKGLALLSLYPEMVGNAKIYIPLFTDHVRLGGGLNTDYYLFYKNSVIYSEGIIGVKIKFKKIRIYAEYHYPFNGSYLEKKERYLGFSIGLFQKHLP